MLACYSRSSGSYEQTELGLYADRCSRIAATGAEAFRDLATRGLLDQADLNRVSLSCMHQPSERGLRELPLIVA